jgi:hypothetical protein
MYKLIGADGKEYGPASAEQVRQWIKQGRADGQTPAQPAGQSGWQPLAGLPEFAEALGAIASRPPPLLPGVSDADEILARDYQLEIGRCFSRGWGLVKQHFWLTVGTAFLAFVLQTLVELVPCIGPMITTVFAMVLWAGVDWLYLKLARGQPATFGDMFSGFRRALVPLMIFSVLTMVLVTMGIFLCLAPGLYLMTVWMMFPTLLIMDKGMDFWPAMELSRKMVHKHFWPVFGLLMVSLVLFFAGLLLLVVGVFVMLAISTAAIVYAYEDIFGSGPEPGSPLAEAGPAI